MQDGAGDPLTEATRLRVERLEKASLLIRVAARALFAGSEKAAAVTLQEALELVLLGHDTGQSAARVEEPPTLNNSLMAGEVALPGLGG